MNKHNRSIAVLVVLLTITLPYVLAYLAGGGDRVFVGFLLNPIDGASYLAKMYQGWAGGWRFVLPFTAEPGQGAYLFLFYLFLGHLARWLSLPLMVVYHGARLIGAGLLLLALFAFFDRVFRERPGLYPTAFWLAVLGSGMGWLVVFSGALPTDFWVAEAYPFLSMFTNPHFSLGLALLLALLSGLLDLPSWRRDLLFLPAGLLLALILPFGEVLAVLVALVWAGWTWIETRCLVWRPVVSLGLLGGPALLYQQWAAQSDPVLAGWNAQNLTPSPPVWDFLLSFSPALLLAFVGFVYLWRRPRGPITRLLAAWFVISLLLVYVPSALQRRFLLGFYIPVAALAAFGLDELRTRFPRRTTRLRTALFALALPTNILLLVIASVGAFNHEPVLYLTGDEYRALNWIQGNTPDRALVLASPEMGRFIPGYTGRRVLYGHPFETINAEQMQKQVEVVYQGQGRVLPGAALIPQQQVDYLFNGPRERDLGGRLDLSALPLVFSAGDVQIYSLRGQP